MQESMIDQAETELEAESVAVQEPVETMDEPVTEAIPSEQSVPLKRVKRRKKAPFIIGGIVLLVIAGLVFWYMSSKEKEPEAEVLTDVVSRGSITSVIEGNGIAKPKSSESISVGTTGTVVDVYVTEGQVVTAGTVLYLINSPGADDAVSKAKKEVEGFQKQLKTLYEAKQNLNIKPEFSGKLLEVQKLKKGDKVTDGMDLARLVDDSKMKLVQYYSTAYQKDIAVGQTAQISVPGVMQQLTGTVTAINKVERISSEGAKLFSVDLSLKNPGTLNEKMPASAILKVGGEEISPYELGALEYQREQKIKAKVNGEVQSNKMQDYLKVSAGEVLVSVSGEDTDTEIFQLQESLKTAQEALTTAQKNKTNLQASAPIDGTVFGLTMAPGDEVAANTPVISIMDNSQMIIEAAIDERSVSYVTPGMMAEIDQFGTVVTGTVESIGLTGKFENGMSTFPAKILVDNMDGRLNNNSSIVYRIQASQSEDCLMLPSQCVKSVADPETGESLTVVFVKGDKAPEGSVTIDGSSLGVPATGFYALPVEIGIADKFNVEILSGVDEGVEVFSQLVQQNSFPGMG